MPLALSCLVAAVFLFHDWPVSASSDRNIIALADSMQRKIDFIQANANRISPKKASTDFQQDEINAYFAERRLTMPDGVRSVRFELSPQRVSARARVDFDEITRARRSTNPLLQLFTGIHNVDAVARTRNLESGMVNVTVESVAIDGVPVPRFVLDLFVKRFVNPKYPNVGLDQDYRLPSRISNVVIADQKGTVRQD